MLWIISVIWECEEVVQDAPRLSQETRDTSHSLLLILGTGYLFHGSFTPFSQKMRGHTATASIRALWRKETMHGKWGRLWWGCGPRGTIRRLPGHLPPYDRERAAIMSL